MSAGQKKNNTKIASERVSEWKKEIHNRDRMGQLKRLEVGSRQRERQRKPSGIYKFCIISSNEQVVCVMCLLWCTFVISVNCSLVS